MLQIRRVLCPIDFSETSRRAFDYAVAIARRHGSTVTVLHVFTPTPVAMYAPAPAALTATIMTPEGRDQVLASMKAFAATDADVRVEFAMTEGPAAGEILANAAAQPTDIIVMGTHGRAGFEHLMLGSVAETVLRTAPCPVLTVPPQRN